MLPTSPNLFKSLCPPNPSTNRTMSRVTPVAESLNKIPTIPASGTHPSPVAQDKAMRSIDVS